MEYAEFESGMSELRDYYGDKAFAPRTLSVIFNIVEPLTRAEFDQLITSIVEEHPRAPVPAAIKRLALPYIRAALIREAQKAISAMESRGETCGWCRLSGLVVAVERSTGCEFGFRCPHCRAAQVRRLSASIPEWNDESGVEFLPATNANHVEAVALQQKKWSGHLPPKKQILDWESLI